MRITRTTRPYNERRYGQPWIATVTFASDGKASFAWGKWITDRAGDAGLLILEAEPETCIAIGQKDHRRPSKSQADYYIVQANGDLLPLTSKVDAYNRQMGKPEPT